MARLVFFGNERIATGVTTTVPVLRRLLADGHTIAAVVSHHTEGRSRRERQLEIAAVAEEHGIPLLLPDKPAEITDQLRELQAEAAVLVAYGKIVPQSVIDSFPGGIINLHPSKLPAHRGPVPLESVILDGSRTTAISIMQLAKAMDAGPVYDQTSYDIPADTSKQQLADALLQLGAERLSAVLPAIIAGTRQPEVQDDAAATYDSLISKHDGQLVFTKTADRLAREIRAYLGWPGSYTRLAERDVVITAAHAASGVGTPGTIWREAKQFGIYTTEGILVIDEIKPAGRSAMPAAAFLAGYQL